MSIATYTVVGMTCGHCVTAVTGEIAALDGVKAVEVDLEVDGSSRVAVTSASPLAVVPVRAAVQEAGYDLAGVTR
jgi:copper chaperone